jgi:hypothetical protein
MKPEYLIKLFVLLFLVFSTKAVSCQNNNLVEALEIGKLDSTYTNGDTIYVKLSNNSLSQICFIIALEKNENGQWIEALDDLYRTGVTKKNHLFRMSAHSNKVMKCIPKDLYCINCETKKKFTGIYRFSLKFGVSIVELNQEKVSNSFILK